MDNLNRSGEKNEKNEQMNFISLLRNPQKFKQSFFELTCVASEGLKNQQFDKALAALNKCADMLDLGKNILKDASKYWKLCIYGNLACAHQGTWEMQKCNKFCEKVEHELQKLLEQITAKQNYLHLTKSIILIRFQHCAILSQLNQHTKALQMCKSTFPYLQKYIQAILDYATSLSANAQDKKSTDTVQFSKQVSAFAQQILQNLLKNLSEAVALTTDKSSFYYWQKNPQNNQQQVKKKFVASKDSNLCKRSILGVNKMSHWIDQFNIGTIMHMSEFVLNDFQHPLPLQQYIFKDKLYEIVIYCSVAHFTIATEMRFIETNKQKQKPQMFQPPINNNPDSNVSPQISSIIKKYGYQQKSDIFRLSELYHLKAINIMAQNIKATVPYISHLIKSYDKHYIYKKQLQPVIAIDQQSLITLPPEIPHTNENNEQYADFQQEEEEMQNCYLLNPLDLLQNQQRKRHISELSRGSQQKQGYVSEKEPMHHQESLQKLQPIPSFVSPPKLKINKSKSKNKGLKSGREQTKSSRLLNNEFKVNPMKKKEKAKQSKTQSEFKESKDPEGKKKKLAHLEGQVRINHQSTTQIKVVFKKKK